MWHHLNIFWYYAKPRISPKYTTQTQSFNHIIDNLRWLCKALINRQEMRYNDIYSCKNKLWESTHSIQPLPIVTYLQTTFASLSSHRESHTGSHEKSGCKTCTAPYWALSNDPLCGCRRTGKDCNSWDYSDRLKCQILYTRFLNFLTVSKNRK